MTARDDVGEALEYALNLALRAHAPRLPAEERTRAATLVVDWLAEHHGGARVPTRQARQVEKGRREYARLREAGIRGPVSWMARKCGVSRKTVRTWDETWDLPTKSPGGAELTL